MKFLPLSITQKISSRFISYFVLIFLVITRKILRLQFRNRKFIFLPLLILLLSFNSILLSGQEHPKLRKSIEKLMSYETKIYDQEIPGFIIGIIDHDSTYILPFGKQAPSPTDFFELGSVSKPISAAVAIQLAAKQTFSLDSSINTYLPIAYQNPSAASFTVRQLLTHHTDLPSRPDNFGDYENDLQNPYAHYPKAALLTAYKNHQFEDSSFHYGDFHFALLEVILENYSGISFENLVQSTLQDSSYCMDCTPIQGYTRTGLNRSPWTFNSFGASVGLKSNMEGLLKFCRLHFNNDDLKEATIQQAESTIGKNIGMGYAWHIIHQKKKQQSGMHTGHTDGHYASIHICSETKTAVVLLSNTNYHMDNLGRLVMNMVNHYWKKRKK